MTLKTKQAEMRSRMKTLKLPRGKSRTGTQPERATEQASAKPDPRNTLVEGPATKKCETCGRERFRERLLPLMSLWLDTLVLRLMNQGDPSLRHAWFVLDELASLQRLPQLHTALTENRKSGNPVVIGFQGRSQLEVRYGHEAESMLSQPATKIFLHTSEPRAAKWISDTIGEVEMERVKETVNTQPLGRDVLGS